MDSTPKACTITINASPKKFWSTYELHVAVLRRLLATWRDSTTYLAEASDIFMSHWSHSFCLTPSSFARCWFTLSALLSDSLASPYVHTTLKNGTLHRNILDYLCVCLHNINPPHE